jgi:hypothetical protein
MVIVHSIYRVNAGAEMVIGWLNFPSGQSAANGTVLWLRTGPNAIASTLRAGSLLIDLLQQTEYF